MFSTGVAEDRSGGLGLAFCFISAGPTGRSGVAAAVSDTFLIGLLKLFLDFDAVVGVFDADSTAVLALEADFLGITSAALEADFLGITSAALEADVLGVTSALCLAGFVANFLETVPVLRLAGFGADFLDALSTTCLAPVSAVSFTAVSASFSDSGAM